MMQSLIFEKGSSAVAMFYSLQGIIDTVQIFALIISSIGEPLTTSASIGLEILLLYLVSISTAESKWKNLFLGIM